MLSSSPRMFANLELLGPLGIQHGPRREHLQSYLDDSAFRFNHTARKPHLRVLRGGSWVSIPRFLRSAGRGRNEPGGRDSSLGFRVARTPD